MDPVDRVKTGSDRRRAGRGPGSGTASRHQHRRGRRPGRQRPQGSIVKSLIFLADGAPLLVLVAGDQRADVKRLRAMLGLSKKRLRIARPARCWSTPALRWAACRRGHEQPCAR